MPVVFVRLLPVLLPAALLATVCLRLVRRGAGLRESLLWAGIACGLAVVLVTEALGAAGMLAALPIAAGWATLSAAAVLVRLPAAPRATARPGPVDRLAARIVITAVAPVALVTLLTAVATPPSNWDTQTYHLSRVMHWLQNGDVGLYPTSVQRQVHANPLAEYALLQAQALSGGDLFANLVQWLAMAGSLVAVSLIAQRLGGGPPAQALAAVVAATLPMGILQSCSTQNDWVVTFFLAALAFFLLRWRDAGDTASLLSGAAALALALLAKGTAYLFATPFVLWGATLALRRGWRTAWRSAAAACAVVAAVNGPFLARTWIGFGSPFGPGGESDAGAGLSYRTDEVSVRITASNLLRNVGLHLGTPWPEVNHVTYRVIAAAHRALGIALDDPRSTWNKAAFGVGPPLPAEDVAGNPLHLLLGAGAAATLLLGRRPGPALRLFTFCVLCGLLLFAAVLRWQPWHSRLHLPLFVLLAAPTALVFEGRRRIALLSCVGLLLGSVQPLFHNAIRPWFGSASIFRTPRLVLLFAARPDLLVQYRDSAELVRRLRPGTVGLVMGLDDWEYPLWRLLRPEREAGTRLEHVLVDNPTRDFRYRGPVPRPDLLLVTRKPVEPAVEWLGTRYHRKLQGRDLSVYLPEGRE